VAPSRLSGCPFRLPPSLDDEGEPTAPDASQTDIDGAAGAVPPIGRRRALSLIAGLGAATLAACGGRSSGGDAAGGDGDAIPTETAGPYPGDGSNGPNVLAQDRVVRRDIRSSFGSASAVADGVPLTVELTIVDAGEDGVDDSTPLPGAAVYLWHCNRAGEYSMYSQGVADENYLRGVQEADGEGRLRFTTVFPGAYSGRWPHIHFEVFASLAEATGGGTPIATSQIALPKDTCALVYASDGYDQSVRNMERTSLESDNVFGDDGGVDQLATVTGKVRDGLVASLTVPV
jgi:protocatechuate 3,4-dioxygenase beta subunit